MHMVTCNARLGADGKYRWRQTAMVILAAAGFFLVAVVVRGRRETKPALGASGGEKVQIDNVTTTICTSKPKVDIRGHSTIIKQLPR